MILLELKRYIQQHQCVSLQDIQHHFDLSEDAALALLAPLLLQGHVLMLKPPNACSSNTCHAGCAHSLNTPHYQWRTTIKKPISIPIQLK